MCDAILSSIDPYVKVMKEINAIVNAENLNVTHDSLETIVDRLEKSATAVSGEDDILRQQFDMNSLLKYHQDKMKEIKTKAERLYQRANDMKYEQFSAKETEDVKKNFLNLFEKFLLYRLEQREMFLYNEKTLVMDTSDFYTIMDFLLDELKTLKRIEKYKKCTDLLQEIKQRFYSLCNTELNKQFVKELMYDAIELQEKMETENLDKLFPDLHKELNDLIVKIKLVNRRMIAQIYLDLLIGTPVGAAEFGREQRQ